MKYVMHKCTKKMKSGGPLVQKVPIMFPDFMVHKDVAEYTRHLLQREHEYDDVRTVSAGFWNVSFPTGEIRCFGESESLKFKHDPEDGTIIATYDYTNVLV